MITYKIDGVPLDDSGGRWKLLSATTVGPGLTVRASGLSVPGVDGSMVGAYEPLEPPSLVVQLRIYGSDHADMRANYAALLPLLAPTGDVTVTKTVDGASVTSTGRGKSITEPDFESVPSMVTVTATLRLPDVYWRGGSADWSKSNPSSGAHYQVTTLDDTYAPVSDALILIGGPIAQPRVTCGGEWCEVAVTLSSSENLLIDCGRWSARRGSGVTFAGGGSLVSGKLGNSGGPYLLRLVPARSGNDPRRTAVKVALSGSGMTSGTSIQVRARPAYLA